MINQTAIDWLVEQIIAPYANIERKENLFVLKPTMSKELFEKAKAKEKEQIIDAYHEGRTDQQSPIDKWYNREKEDFYNQTYGGDK